MNLLIHPSVKLLVNQLLNTIAQFNHALHTGFSVQIQIRLDHA